MLEQVVEIAREAGSIVQRHYASSSSPEVITKEDGSPLTLADRESNAFIVRRLRALTPDVPIVAEETEVPPYEIRRSWTRFWLVDPLDGTKEFLHRNGEFTINIALVEDGEPVLGVVYAPALDVLYAAARGHGAWKSVRGEAVRRIHSTPPDRSEPLVVVTSRSHRGPSLRRMLPGVRIREERTVGSALKFGLLAEGAVDVYARETPTKEWDVAAGDCIFRESGAARRRSSPLTYNKPTLVNEPFAVGLEP